MSYGFFQTYLLKKKTKRTFCLLLKNWNFFYDMIGSNFKVNISIKVNDRYKLKQIVFTNKILGRKRPWNTEKGDHLHDCCTDRLDQDSLEVSLLVQQSCQIENHAQNFFLTLPVTFSDKWKLYVKSMTDFLDPQK